MRTGRAALAMCAILVLTATTGTLASAEPARYRTDPNMADFYQPPTPLPPGTEGDIIRAEPSPLAYSLPWKDGNLPSDATRLMYRSQDSRGEPIAVTGTYFDPTVPWHGPGPRPVISLAPGTHGQGDQCAPSKLVNAPYRIDQPGGPMLGYEMAQASALLMRGYAVVMTDYAGLGTPGTHTYVNRLSGARAVLDAARAADRLPDTELAPNPRVGLWGYSQGGGAAAAAAEEAKSYAPELDVQGTYAGAPPADLRATLRQADGSSLTGAIGYTLNGFAASEPEIRPILDENINQAGKEMLDSVARQCVGQTAIDYGFRRTADYTASGRPLDEMLRQFPIAQRVLDQNRIGGDAPSAPALVVAGSTDDIVPHGQAEQLAADWCTLGSTVEFRSIPGPPVESLRTGAVHALSAVPGLFAAAEWMDQRFADEPAPSSCAPD